MIYVDDMLMEAQVGRIKARWSHLFCDTDDQTELHEFAARLGLRRSWFQHEHKYPDRPEMWHYDVTEKVRKRALALGAAEVSYPWGNAELMKKRWEAREQGQDTERAAKLARMQRVKP